jgi:ABC-type multidrug transport system fused ATPase/permease subunit
MVPQGRSNGRHAWSGPGTVRWFWTDGTRASPLKPSVDSTGELVAVSNEAATAAERFLAVMDTPRATDQAEAGPPAVLGSAPAGLVFDQIRFRYPDTTAPDGVSAKWYSRLSLGLFGHPGRADPPARPGRDGRSRVSA